MYVTTSTTIYCLVTIFMTAEVRNSVLLLQRDQVFEFAVKGSRTAFN